MFNVKKIKSSEFLRMIEGKAEFQILSIAQRSYYIPENIIATKVTISEVEENFNLVRKDVPVIVVCDHGESSFFLATIIQIQDKNINVFSLEGGLKKLREVMDK